MPAAKAGPPLMVVIGGLLRERQFIRAPIKNILPARLSRAKRLNTLPISLASADKAGIGPNKLPSS